MSTLTEREEICRSAFSSSQCLRSQFFIFVLKRIAKRMKVNETDKRCLYIHTYGCVCARGHDESKSRRLSRVKLQSPMLSIYNPIRNTKLMHDTC